MRYSIDFTDDFERELKKLSKRYLSIKSDLAALVNILITSPTVGTPLGKGLYKVRMAISSKGSGKSGGARVLTLVRISQGRVTLLTVYDKSEKENLTDKEIRDLIKNAP